MRPDHFDAVIVGSGFGGSVAAYRLAEAGLSVCLLERGRAYPPGSFPRTPSALKRAFWDPSEGLYGMFDVWSFKGLEALVGSGLGGGSLIYANVLLRKDERWFMEDAPDGTGTTPWPVSRTDLDPHYDRVERMMNVQLYPDEHAPYDATSKMHALREAGERLGLPWQRVPLAVTFADDGQAPVPGARIAEAVPNLHGRERVTCRLCGECDVGCNYGSKNTLDFNYLSAAERHGAVLRTLCEVRAFRPEGEGYVVDYVEHDLEREGAPYDTRALPVQRITADRLVLGAGTLGSTYLLLKNRPHLPALSERLGHRFCGNGDLLGFVMDATRRDEARGTSGPRPLDPNLGPVITSALRLGDALDGDGTEGRGAYIEDAGYPVFLSWLVEASDVFGATKRLGRLVRRALAARLSGDSNLSAELQDLIGGVRSACALPLLGMGRDVADGCFTLRDGRLQTDWALRGSRDYFDRLRGTMKDIADVLGGDFVMNPTWMMKRVVTVHPLGGCAIGRDAAEGVVDAYGEVFGHPNLYVADGAILPGPVGPNPSLTIAALSDRIAERIAEDHRPRANGRSAAVAVPQPRA